VSTGPGEAADDGDQSPTALSHEIRDLTGWTERELSGVLERSCNPARFVALHGVLARLGRVAGDQQALATVLGADDGTGSAIGMLRAQQWSRAFTTALDHLHGPRPEMVVPEPGRELPAATRALGD